MQVSAHGKQSPWRPWPERVAEALGKWRWWVLALAVVVTTLAGWRTVLTYKALRSDLEELLPETAPSVAALGKLRERLPGVRYLGIVVDTGGAANVDAANRFVDALRARIATYPPEMVGAVRADLSVEKEFLETYGLQLMEPSDLRTLREAVEKRKEWEVSHALGTNLDDESEDPKPTIPIDALREKYEERLGKQQKLPGDRFVAQDGSTVVLLVQASSHSTSYDADAALLKRVQGDVSSLAFPGAFASGMRVGYAGDVATRVEEMDGLASDLSISGILAVGLVLLSIRWFFGNWWSIAALGLPLTTGTLATFGLVALPPLSIQHLNTNTGFLGSVIVGNGINSGIMLLARFAEERRRGGALSASVNLAVSQTWRATLAAAAAAASAYASLIFTDFRGFNQFGYVGGLGMLVCWAAMYTLVPALLVALGDRRTAFPPAAASKMGWGARLVLACVTRPRLAIATASLLTAGAIAGLAARGNDWLEQDFSKLRRRDSFVSGERYWGKRMDDTLQRYLTPTIILASDGTQAARIEDRVRTLLKDGKAGGLISSVRSSRELLPDTRVQAVEEVKRLRAMITQRMKSELSADDRALLDRALGERSTRVLQPEMIPDVLAAGMREQDHRMDRSVLVFPQLTTGTWNGTRIRAFADDLREAASIDPGASVAGSLPLSADLTRAMMHDGPRATALGLAAALVICALAFGSLRLSAVAMGAILVGVVLMMGGIGWTGARLNFSNFVVLPITFGVAADYSINVLRRYQAEGPLGSQAALASTSGAVGLCSATTIIGFGSLLAAQNQALFSFGFFAAAGEVSTLAVATLVLPAVLASYDRRRVRADAMQVAKEASPHERATPS